MLQSPRYHLEGRVRALDVETFLISPGAQAPEVVCMSSAYLEGTKIVSGPLAAKPEIRDLILSSDFLGASDHFPHHTIIVGHNIAFDLCVLMSNFPDLIVPIFRGLERGRFVCTMLASRLYENALGRLQIQGRRKLEHETVGAFSLAGCVDRYLGLDLSEGKQSGSWRYRYSELAGLPVSSYPQDAVDYANSDSIHTVALFKALLTLADDPNIPRQSDGEVYVYSDLAARTRAAVALRLMECWGVRTDADRVTALAKNVAETIDAANRAMKAGGVMRDDGSLDMALMRERVVQAFQRQNIPPPKTDKGNVKTDRETLRNTGDPLLEGWAQAGFAFKVKSTFLPVVERGTTQPVHARYQVMVETGRTSCSNPPLQQIPRSSGALGVRECFVPRPGYAFVAADYDAIEMRTFAQVLLDQVGSSEMAEQFQADPDFDPHTFFAMHLSQGRWDSLSVSEKKDLRTRSKAANFGFSGALGVTTFLKFCKGFGLTLSHPDAQRLKTLWFNTYPEVRQYFKDISGRLDPFENTGPVFHRRSDRIRGKCSFTQSANSPFQGMSADGALHALFLVAQECYGAVPDEGLRGSRPCLYIHDEIILETPLSRVHEAGYRLCELMEKGMGEYVPDIPIKASPLAMTRWSKDAEATFDSSGKLVVWSDSSGQ